MIDIRRTLERLIQAENQGGSSARNIADGILAPDFLGFTGGSGVEQGRSQYLAHLEDADKAGSSNKLRWLDIASRETAPDLVEPSASGPHKDSSINRLGSFAVVRAVVATRAREAPSIVDGRFRNIFVLVEQSGTWQVYAWQVTPLK